MRGKIALISLLTTALLVGATPATGEPVPTPASAPAPASAADLPEEVDGGDIVDLADGDRFKATVSNDQTTVWGSRYDAATRSWGERSVVFKKKNVFCRDVDARTAGAAVALIARCTKRDSSEARRPPHSQALYSSDTVTWSSFTLPGEVFNAPGISPSGTNAIWPLRQHGWVTWTAAGFVTVQRDVSDLGKGREFTGTISDTGDVSVLYVADSLRQPDCVLNVLSVAATGSETRQELDFHYYHCDSVELTNVDATTVLIGSIDQVGKIQTLTRLDPASPWALTGVAPADAPGLVRYGGRGTATTRIAYSPGLALLAVGSPDQKSFTAQTFDPVAQTWSVPAEIKRTAHRCHWRGEFAVLAVFALPLTCSGNGEHSLVSTDAQVWHDIHRSRSPLGVSPDGRFVATSNQKRTLIFSRERGVVRLRSPTRARCDVIQPVSPNSAIRLTTTGKRGWPGRLDVSTAKGWKPTKTPIPRLGYGTNRCRVVAIEEAEHYFGLLEREWRPVSYTFLTYQSGDLGETLTVFPRGDGWKVRRTTIVYMRPNLMTAPGTPASGPRAE